MQVEWVKIGNIQQITSYVSKMVQDKGIASIKVEWEAICILSRLSLTPAVNSM